MRKILTTLGLTLLVTSAADAFGPPVYSVGDTWTFTNREQKVVQVEDGVVVMNGVSPQCPSCLYHFDRNLVAVGDLSLARVPDRVDFRPRGAFALRGRSHSVDGFELTRVQRQSAS